MPFLLRVSLPDVPGSLGRVTREGMGLQHEGFDLVDGCPGVLKGDLDIPRLDGLKSCLNGFGTRDDPIETSLFRVIDLCIFHRVIAAVPVLVNII